MNIKHGIEGRIEGTGRRGRRRKQLLDVLKERRGYGNRKRKQQMALCGELALEDVMDLSQITAE
jgi:hypothetical protein